MHCYPNHTRLALIVGVLCLLIGARVGLAHDWHWGVAPANEEISRAGAIEIFAEIQGWLNSDAISSDIGLDLKFDPAALAGFGVGYHFTDHISAHFDAVFGAPSFVIPELNASQNVTSVSLTGHVDYNILKTRLTPVLSAGIGAMSIEGDSDIDLDDLTYSVGGGFRWDVSNYVFMKLMYESVWIDFRGDRNPLRLDTLILYFGLKY